ncbi:MAG: hypothetical protein ACLUP5_04075 [Streptococcus sp.]
MKLTPIWSLEENGQVLQAMPMPQAYYALAQPMIGQLNCLSMLHEDARGRGLGSQLL